MNLSKEFMNYLNDKAKQMMDQEQQGSLSELSFDDDYQDSFTEGKQQENENQNVKETKNVFQNQQKQQCEMCEENKSKYTCPACKRKTCSLKCINVHKKKFDCDGKYRQEAQNFKKSELNEKQIKKDFNYIENTIQDTENIKKKVNFVTKTPELLRFKLLKTQLYKKLNAQLQFAPAIMQRHRENLGFYYVKTKLIFLNLEIKFPYIDKNTNKLQFKRYVLDPQSEGEKLSDILVNADFSDNKLTVDYGLDLTPIKFKEMLMDQNQIKVYIQNIYKTNELRRLQNQDQEFEYKHWFDIEQVPENQVVEIPFKKFFFSDILKFLRIKEFPVIFLVHQDYNEQFLEHFNKICEAQQIKKENQNNQQNLEQKIEQADDNSNLENQNQNNNSNSYQNLNQNNNYNNNESNIQQNINNEIQQQQNQNTILKTPSFFDQLNLQPKQLQQQQQNQQQEKTVLEAASQDFYEKLKNMKND